MQTRRDEKLSLDQESILPAEAAIGAAAGAEEEGSVRFSETVETSTGDGKTAGGRISGAREKKETRRRGERDS